MYTKFTKWAFLITSVSALLCLLGVHDHAKLTLFGLVVTAFSMTHWPYVPQGGIIHGVHGALHPSFGKIFYFVGRWIFALAFAYMGFRENNSSYASKKRSEMRKKLLQGDTVYLVGINAGAHNTGISLVSVSRKDGINLLYNFEEERYSGDKHHAGLPTYSIRTLFKALKEANISKDQIHAVVHGWDFLATGMGLLKMELIENFPKGLVNFLPSRWQHMAFFNMSAITKTHKFVNEEFARAALEDNDTKKPEQYNIISSRHHDNHAYFSFFASPFSQSKEPVMVCAIDAQGDDCSISLYTTEWQEEGKYNKLKMVYTNGTTTESIGALYAIISSTQGGWTALSSEGRYMGATAFGNIDRMTNPFYKRLREIVFFGPDGQVFLNRAMANWSYDMCAPYTQLLTDVLGPPIPFEKLWNPDAILNVDKITHAKITTERCDKAAALQMVFEDCIFHIISHLINITDGSTKLVWTGGTALNCLASMRLLEHFNEDYYERYFYKGSETDEKTFEKEKESDREERRLHMWVPPIPGDAGVAAGSAYQFAMSCGVPLKTPRLRHAFYCGVSPTGEEILTALKAMGNKVGYRKLGNTKSIINVKGEEVTVLHQIADLMAYLVSNDAIIGIYQGPAETGPRALGHRTILANPCNPLTSQVLNKHVKYRERVRPLAPMVTLEAAKEHFYLSPGGSTEDYCAYDWMVLTTVVKEESRAKVPAVVHADNTSRLQIVRKENNELCHTYLKCMGRRCGFEISVNTSLNVGTPIVQTPEQAVDCIKRSKGMHGIFLVGEEGDVYVVWDSEVAGELKDGGKQLNTWLKEWSEETSFQFDASL